MSALQPVRRIVNPQPPSGFTGERERLRAARGCYELAPGLVPVAVDDTRPAVDALSHVTSGAPFVTREGTSHARSSSPSSSASSRFENTSSRNVTQTRPKGRRPMSDGSSLKALSLDELAAELGYGLLRRPCTADGPSQNRPTITASPGWPMGATVEEGTTEARASEGVTSIVTNFPDARPPIFYVCATTDEEAEQAMVALLLEAQRSLAGDDCIARLPGEESGRRA